jgi:hypothetical protein
MSRHRQQQQLLTAAAWPPSLPCPLPPFLQPAYYNQTPDEAAEKVGATTGFVYLICLLANTMAMLLAWFFIFVSGRAACVAEAVCAAGAV